MDITRMPLPDSSFDIILCSHVLEHVEDDRRAMAEMYRVLRPGGSAIIQVPLQGDTTLEDPSATTADERKRLFGQHDHVRIYGLDITKRLEDAGFGVETEAATDLLPLGDLSRHGIPVAERLFVARTLEPI
jgi:SAM-dependent methyltransferase